MRHSRHRPRPPRCRPAPPEFGQQAVAQEGERHVALDHLHGDVGVVVHAERVSRGAVAIGQRAAAADLDLDQHLAPLLGIDGLERDDIGDGVVGRRHALRHRLVQRAEQHGRQPVADGDAMHHGRRRRGVHAGARRGDDLHRAIAAGVGGDRRVGRRHQARRTRSSTWRRSVALLGPIDCGLQPDRSTVISSPATDHLGVDADRLVGDAVVVDVVLELVGAVGDAPDHGAHAGLRGVEHLLQRALEARLAELVGEALDAGRAHVQRGELRLQIAPQQLRLAHVLQDGGAQRLVQLAGLEQLHRRDAQALLEDLDGSRSRSCRARSRRRRGGGTACRRSRCAGRCGTRP